MPLTHVVVLAIVQGFTEFLPISSTAHLYLTSWLLGWKAESLTFDIALHLGTLAAVLIYFFKDWVQIVAQGFGLTYGSDPQLKANPTLLWLLAIATVPVGIFGFLFNKQAESTWRTPVLMATTLIGVGLLMGIADHVTRNRQKIGQVRLSDAGAIGLAQALAIVPGVSRSGITITAGLFRNLNRESAARFSFLLSTPAIAGAAAKALYDLLKQGGITPGMEVAFAVGILVSAVTGFLVIAWFLSFLQHNTLRFFVWYRIVFGVLVLILALVVRK